jgi:hypothetical protein
MSRFTLISETIEVRGQQITVRELTSKQKGDWAKAAQADVYSAPYMLVALVCEPGVSADEAAGWPADVVERIVDVARRLSGMDSDDEKKD